MHQAGEPAIGILIIPLALIAGVVFMLFRCRKRPGQRGWSVFAWIGLGLAALLALGVSWSFVGYRSLQAPAEISARRESSKPRSSRSKPSSSPRAKAPDVARTFLPPEPAEVPPPSVATTRASEPGKLSVPPLEYEEPAPERETPAKPPAEANRAANKPRPAWVDVPGEVRPDGTVVVTIKSSRTREISHAMNLIAAQRHNVTQQQITQTLNRHGQRASVYGLYRWLPETIEQIGTSAQKEIYQEWDDARNVAIFARLEFTPQWEAKVISLAHQATLNQRMFFAAALGAFAVGLLGIGYAYLRFNAATHGAYCWRLRLAALASAATLVFIFAIVCDVTRMDDDVLFPWL